MDLPAGGLYQDAREVKPNLGHDGVLTTFYSYGTVAPSRQGEIIKNLTDVAPAILGNEQEQAMRVFRALQSAGFTRA